VACKQTGANLIQARPEVIAQKVALEEAKSRSVFADRLAGVIESLAREADENSAGYKIAMLKGLFDHQRQSVLSSEQIKVNVVAMQQSGVGKPTGAQP
jgi:ribosomal protein L11 methylase PrmA